MFVIIEQILIKIHYVSLPVGSKKLNLGLILKLFTDDTSMIR